MCIKAAETKARFSFIKSPRNFEHKSNLFAIQSIELYSTAVSRPQASRTYRAGERVVS